jgi:hypothetical protein
MHSKQRAERCPRNHTILITCRHCIWQQPPSQFVCETVTLAHPLAGQLSRNIPTARRAGASDSLAEVESDSLLLSLGSSCSSATPPDFKL